MRRTRLQFIENRVANALRIAPQMRIPKPQRLDAARLQKLFPLHIVFALIGKTVLAAVQFHIQIRFLAKEIEIVNADGMLAAKLVAGKTTATQPSPHELFRPCFLFAKLADAFDVGHDGKLGNDGEAGKFVLTPALTFYPLPRGEDFGKHGPGNSIDCPANPGGCGVAAGARRQTEAF